MRWRLDPVLRDLDLRPGPGLGGATGEDGR